MHNTYSNYLSLLAVTFDGFLVLCVEIPAPGQPLVYISSFTLIFHRLEIVHKYSFYHVTLAPIAKRVHNFSSKKYTFRTMPRNRRNWRNSILQLRFLLSTRTNHDVSLDWFRSNFSAPDRLPIKIGNNSVRSNLSTNSIIRKAFWLCAAE